MKYQYGIMTECFSRIGALRVSETLFPKSVNSSKKEHWIRKERFVFWFQFCHLTFPGIFHKLPCLDFRVFCLINGRFREPLTCTQYILCIVCTLSPLVFVAIWEAGMKYHWQMCCLQKHTAGWGQNPSLIIGVSDSRCWLCAFGIPVRVSLLMIVSSSKKIAFICYRDP
jgi:hypothetical protein